jgi:hypothetical protein
MKEADTTKLNSSSNKTHRSFFMSSTASYLSPEDFGLLLEWEPQPPHPATDTILSVIGGGERYLLRKLHQSCCLPPGLEA